MLNFPCVNNCSIRASEDYLAKSKNPHIIVISPHPNLTAEFFHQYDFAKKLSDEKKISTRWFQSLHAGQMALFGTADPIRYRSIQLQKKKIALNGLWPSHRK